MNAEELRNAVHGLPALTWEDRLTRRYLTALVRYHERLVRDGDEPRIWVCNALERLLEIEQGARNR